jgi:nitrogen fixation protein NifQ
MSLPIRSLPDVAARVAVALPPFADGEALAASLARSAARAGRDAFLIEIFSRLFAHGILEAREQGATLEASLGLGRAELERLAGWLDHPEAQHWAAEAGEPSIDEEEEQVRGLLASQVVDGSREGRWLVAMVARRAMQPNHLWQDLGLANRSWLNELLRRFFPALHAGNVADMKWKKYFYRKLCELEGFTLCTAPSCRECCDFDRCFGAEDGQSLLARTRRATETVSDI